jgi:hypothetical protein
MYITDSIPYADIESGLSRQAGGESGLSSKVIIFRLARVSLA